MLPCRLVQSSYARTAQLDYRIQAVKIFGSMQVERLARNWRFWVTLMLCTLSGASPGYDNCRIASIPYSAYTLGHELEDVMIAIYDI